MTDSEPHVSTFAERLDYELACIRGMLLAQNDYGNSALEPVRCFSNADPVEQIRVRIDDKISRLMRGNTTTASAAAAEDTVADLIGYLVLLRIATRG